MIVSGRIEKNAVIPEGNMDFPDGTKVNIIIYPDSHPNSTGLCGIWKDSRSAQEICQDVISSRSKGRKVEL